MELYDSAAPQRGLLALLKYALWQTLWVDYGPPSGATLHLAVLCQSNITVVCSRADVDKPDTALPSMLVSLAQLAFDS